MGEMRVVEVGPQEALSIREKVGMPDIGLKMGEMLSELMAFFKQRKIPVAGPPYALYHGVSEGTVDVEVGFPTPARMLGEGRIRAAVVPGGKVVAATHIGPYDRLHETYGEMQRWMTENGLVPSEIMWEQYLTDPQRESDSSKWMTNVYWPIR